MKNRIYSVLALSLMCLLMQQVKSQVVCGQRYKDMIFDGVTVDSVTYSTPFSLKMNIYQPIGDTSSARPVLILAHGGSFIGGDRYSDNVIITLCTNFALRGYVTVSIDYRLGNPISMATDSSYAINEVMEAIGDGKAAVRWMRMNYYNGNTYKIDTNNIFCGGNSAGAVLYEHQIYIQDTTQLTPTLLAIINANGGLEGNSGNPGYSSSTKALLSAAGGLNDPDWINASSKPVVSFQGSADDVVPYVCGLAEGGAINVRLCGLGSLEPLFEEFNVFHSSTVYPGDGHVPWQDTAYLMVQVDTISANFFDTVAGGLHYEIVCPDSVFTSIANVSNGNQIKVFPNPAMTEVNISIQNPTAFNSIQLIDELGRIVDEKRVTSQLVTFNRGKLASGVYLAKIIAIDNSTLTRKVIFE